MPAKRKNNLYCGAFVIKGTKDKVLDHQGHIVKETTHHIECLDKKYYYTNADGNRIEIEKYKTVHNRAYNQKYQINLKMYNKMSGEPLIDANGENVLFGDERIRTTTGNQHTFTDHGSTQPIEVLRYNTFIHSKKYKKQRSQANSDMQLIAENTQPTPQFTDILSTSTTTLPSIDEIESLTHQGNNGFSTLTSPVSNTVENIPVLTNSSSSFFAKEVSALIQASEEIDKLDKSKSVAIKISDICNSSNSIVNNFALSNFNETQWDFYRHKRKAPEATESIVKLKDKYKKEKKL